MHTDHEHRESYVNPITLAKLTGQLYIVNTYEVQCSRDALIMVEGILALACLCLQGFKGSHGLHRLLKFGQLLEARKLTCLSIGTVS